MAGTAAPTAFCAVVRSEMPAADAILATRSGVKNCDTADTMFPYMASSSLCVIVRSNSIVRCAGLIATRAQGGSPQGAANPC